MGCCDSPNSLACAVQLALEEELAEVRTRGYATNFEESQSGVCSVAAAIRHPTRGTVAALGISTLVTRMDAKQLRGGPANYGFPVQQKHT